MLLIVLILVVIVLSIIGMEIAWAIAMACLAFIFMTQMGWWDREIPLVLFAQSMREGLNSFVLLAIPLFVFAGELMNASGVTHRMVRVASVLVGHRSGGLANVGVTANFIMSGVSGSAVADAAATGTVLVPEMTKRGFPPTFSSAVIASAATVGPIIPPSLVFVLLGAIVEVSVGRLFLAGVLPGVIMFVAMFLTTWWICRARGFPVEPRATRQEKVSAAFDGLFALLAPIIIVGSIVGGVATPTEGAAVAVAYTLVLGFVVYRSLTIKAVIEAAGATAIASGVIMLTVATSQIFAWLAVQARMGEILTEWMLSISDNVWVLLGLANIIMLVLGTFMELLPIMLILAPILFPLFAGMGIDPVHLGVVMVLNLMIGMITPPIGLNLFVLAAISKQGVFEIFREALPYFVTLMIVLALITYVPMLTLTIPTFVMPK
ncbi:MAG: TRAP transporter large permease [Alphaproteobacteria bacterium]|nr:TRAP transporter large permease [Alphaproteobacteria bacterium]